MKALVVYGTRWGTATEIAQEISKVIKDEGIEADLVDARGLKNFDVSPYDLVVVGSGIKMGKWTKGSLKFLKNYKSDLASKKVALFVTCGAANKEDTQEEGWEKYLKKVAADNLVNPPVDLGLFGSVYDPDANHGLLFKFTNRFIKKDLEKQGIDTTKRQDYRDWDEIRAWAKGLVKT
ncbi:MAG: flavodoxin domain-containing protein [Methanobacterium sp.]|uniref:flavodoxin domain-containing protein n=1 Tax=Methanobacterium sp. TaxID=2164 RepID=UPI003D65F0CA|nr:flavodoxin domain-containing protein [Methanobacterium sp.]